jgi:UDP-N-acetylglucosamine 2-epimerase
VALAFGIAPKNLSKAELIATIEAFLTLLVTQQKRALLVVDEAQNLHREAVEELRMLSNFQLGNRALLQSFLVGQPELRALLTSKPMEQFRQRVIASCHLGPMDNAETHGYIRHRLHRVGWNGNPSFEPEAFDRIFHWSSGIPRRVNLLCNRLLLSTYLTGGKRIDAASVDAIGLEVRGEVGDAALDAAPVLGVKRISRSLVAETSGAQESVPRESRIHAGPGMQQRVVIREHRVAGPLMCVAAGPFEELRYAPLMLAMRAYDSIPDSVLVRLGDTTRFMLNDSFLGALGLRSPTITLEIAKANPANQMADAIRRFAQTVEEHRPSAVVVVGASDFALACSLVASKMNCRLVHVEAGVRVASPSFDALSGLLIDRVAQVFYPASMTGYINLIREGVSETQIENAGSLLADAVSAAVTFARPVRELALRNLEGQPPQPLAGTYGMVWVDDSVMRGDIESVTELLSNLLEISREAMMVWPLSRSAAARLDALKLRSIATPERLLCIEPVNYLDGIALLKNASFVVTDEPDVQMQAAVLGVRCLPMGAAAAAPKRQEAPEAGTPHPAQRISAHMANWIASSASLASR